MAPSSPIGPFPIATARQAAAARPSPAAQYAATAAMIRLGRTYSNLMVTVPGSNAKLRQRQLGILREASGAGDEACRAALAGCGGDLRLALLCLLSGLNPRAAADALAEAGGSVRAALARVGTPGRAGRAGGTA
jgi:N-acetylmuramic acid 6-phosphate etherase